MLERGDGFFPRLGEDETPEAFIEHCVDACFDLAYALRSPPELYLSLPLDDLAFYVAAANRLAKRMKG